MSALKRERSSSSGAPERSLSHRIRSTSPHRSIVPRDPLKFCRIYNDPAADTVLVSEDGVRFKVDSMQLRAVSGVFKDMFATVAPGKSGADQGEPILIDAKGASVRIFLDLVCGNAMRPQKFPDLRYDTGAIDYDGDEFMEVAAILEKFDCRKGLLERLVHNACRLLDQTPWTAFCLAAAGEDIQTAKRVIAALDCAPQDTQNAMRPDQLKAKQVGAAPPLYFHAYTRAYIQALRTRNGLQTTTTAGYYRQGEQISIQGTKGEPRWADVAQKFFVGDPPTPKYLDPSFRSRMVGTSAAVDPEQAASSEEASDSEEDDYY